MTLSVRVDTIHSSYLTPATADTGRTFVWAKSKKIKANSIAWQLFQNTLRLWMNQVRDFSMWFHLLVAHSATLYSVSLSFFLSFFLSFVLSFFLFLSFFLSFLFLSFLFFSIFVFSFFYFLFLEGTARARLAGLALKKKKSRKSFVNYFLFNFIREFS